MKLEAKNTVEQADLTPGLVFFLLCWNSAYKRIKKNFPFVVFLAPHTAAELSSLRYADLNFNYNSSASGLNAQLALMVSISRKKKEIVNEIIFNPLSNFTLLTWQCSLNPNSAFQFHFYHFSLPSPLGRANAVEVENSTWAFTWVSHHFSFSLFNP